MHGALQDVEAEADRADQQHASERAEQQRWREEKEEELMKERVRFFDMNYER